MLRFGPDAPSVGAPVAVVALPLFEEANRTRAFAVSICRALADRGVASVLPDVPGQSESLVPTEHLSLTDLRDSFAAVVEHLYWEKHLPYSATIRSGAILDTKAHCLGRWSLTPRNGRQVVADLSKILAAAGRNVDALTVRNPHQNEDERAIEVAGNAIPIALLQDLDTDAVFDRGNSLGIPSRVVRLETDTNVADRHVPGAPLWRRAEPGDDPALATLLADDIADWIARCGG